MNISTKTGLPMYDQSLVARSEEGMFWHPDLPDGDDDTNLWPLVQAQGFEIAVVSGEYDEDAFPEEVMSEGGDEYFAALGAWNPATGEHEGWLIAAVFDSEDGPTAWLVRPVAVEGATNG